VSRASEPVSWLLIERGWKVEAADGTEVGKVEDTIGDSTADIFSGLAVSTGLLRRPRYVPAEKVAEIALRRVRLAIDAEAFARLEAYEEPPPSEQILPE
jgi:hypothetical protein